MPGKTKPSTIEPAEPGSVSGKILSEFIAAISEDPDLPGVGERLKKVILEDRDLSDAALRQALFGDPSL